MAMVPEWGEIHGWYYYEDFMKFFKGYLEPIQELLAFPNTERFNSEPETGNWKTYADPRLADRPRPVEENEEPEADQNSPSTSQQQSGYDRYHSRGGRGPRRGGGGSRGQARGYFNNNYNNNNSYDRYGIY